MRNGLTATDHAEARRAENDMVEMRMAQSLMLPRMSGAAKCGELARLEKKKLPMHAVTMKCSGVDDTICITMYMCEYSKVFPGIYFQCSIYSP